MIIKRSAYYRPRAATSASLLRANSRPCLLNFSSPPPPCPHNFSSGISAIGLKRCNEQYVYSHPSFAPSQSVHFSHTAWISAFLSGEIRAFLSFSLFFRNRWTVERRNNCRIHRKIEGVYGLSASLLLVSMDSFLLCPRGDTSRDAWTLNEAFFSLSLFFLRFFRDYDCLDRLLNEGEDERKCEYEKCSIRIDQLMSLLYI